VYLIHSNKYDVVDFSSLEYKVSGTNLPIGTTEAGKAKFKRD